MPLYLIKRLISNMPLTSRSSKRPEKKAASGFPSYELAVDEWKSGAYRMGQRTPHISRNSFRTFSKRIHHVFVISFNYIIVLLLFVNIFMIIITMHLPD